MRDTVPGLGTVTWSELVWSHGVPELSPESAPPGSRGGTGRPGHTLRMMENICFDVPLVCGDVVETRPARPPGPDGRGTAYPQVTRAVIMQEGLLVTAAGYAEISRRDAGPSVGPGVSDLVCDCGHCSGPGLDAQWWDRCESVLVARGAALVETDGDRIVTFFPEPLYRAEDRARDMDRVAEICCSAGMVRSTLQILDRASREVFLGLRLVGEDTWDVAGEGAEEDAAPVVTVDADGGGTADGPDRGAAA